MPDFSEFGENAGYVEALYQSFLNDQGSVPEVWAEYFTSLPHDGNGHQEARAEPFKLQKYFKPHGLERPRAKERTLAALQARVTELVRNYRSLGHLKALINPLTQGVFKVVPPKELEPEYYDFKPQEMEEEVLCSSFRGASSFVLADLVRGLERTYCSSVGFEYMHITNSAERNWLLERVEREFPDRGWFSSEEKRALLKILIETELFDAELHLKYPGSKRFSLRGAETLNTMLTSLLDAAGEAGVREMLLGMSHRGRINVLGSIGGQPMSEIVAEFEDRALASAIGAGDVKYHLGHSAMVTTAHGKQMLFFMASNPSHLESVDPVIAGMARARQDELAPGERRKILPVLIHGDAAFSGQGVAWETLNLSGTPGYTSEGTLHIVVNNQLGFTTDPQDGRSSIYCADLAKGIEAPIFHVNSEDIEACSWVTRLAFEFRQKFGRDVVIDLYCYRKFGHNEGDDPSFTQPQMYAEIKGRKSLAELYAHHLINSELITEPQVNELEAQIVSRIKAGLAKQEYATVGDAVATYGRIQGPAVETKVDKEKLMLAASAMIEYPPGFSPHPKLKAIMEKRFATVAPGGLIEWGSAEELALSTLVMDGCNVRLSGQDTGRGTFSQRHLEVHHYSRDEHFYPIAKLAKKLGLASRFEVYNSPLSEAAVLGFEWGYACYAQSALVLWEAQFGDFANGAQVHIDQYLTSSEAKWGQRSGVVLLLPHGYEGQGPEHSSARFERFLSLSAHGNLIVCYPTSAAQYFHLLRRQGLALIKRPLVILTPKSLLRAPEASSPFEDFTMGGFSPLIRTDFGGKGKKRHVVCLSGKMYYEVAKALERETVPVTVVRFEEIYPFRDLRLQKVLGDIEVKSCNWVQEEPSNMGAFHFIEDRLRRVFSCDVRYFGRRSSGSTATGSLRWHQKEQQAIIEALMQSF